MIKFCENKKCFYHVDVKEEVRKLILYAGREPVMNNIIISNASTIYGNNDKIRKVMLCDVCKQAIEIFLEIKGGAGEAK